MKKGTSVTKEVIKRLSLLNLGGKNPMFGKHHTNETKEKLRKKNEGKHHTNETKEKLRKAGILQFEKAGSRERESRRGIARFKESGVRERAKKQGILQFEKPGVRERESKRMKEFHKNHPELAEKIKRIRAKQIFPVKDTKIEVKIQNLLRQLNYDFLTHHYVKIKHGYQCDVFIQSLNLIIECDGDYWHNYPIGNEIDHVRTKELIDSGFKILRLWGREINQMDVNDLRKKIGGS